MLKTYTCILILSLFIISCTSNKTPYSKILNRDSIPSQFITVDNDKDQEFTTANGALIKIDKGTFSESQVKLEVKEAYSIEQMVLAGLTTESNGKPLSSGGMIYINATETAVSINKPINISIPTNYYDNRMQLFEGEEKDGKINWTDPEPLPSKDSLPAYLESGRMLFQQNCSSCHSLDKDLTGPKLSGVELRGPWRDRSKLFAFTRNPVPFMAQDFYTHELKTRYATLMTAFPQLNDESLNALYDYIRNEDFKKGIDYNKTDDPCADSCRIYDSIYAEVNNLVLKRQNLINDNGHRINFDRNFPAVNVEGEISINPDPIPEVDRVVPVDYQSIYYRFDIKTFGWSNLDFKIEDEGNQTELKVEIRGEHKNNMSVFLVIPQSKMFGEGGVLNGETHVFGFWSKDGKVPMAVGTTAIVFAVGESDGEMMYDFNEFISTEKNRIILEPKPVSKREFNKSVKKFGLQDVKIKADESKNSKEIRKTDKQIKKKESILQYYKPKNCNCNCVQAADTTIKEESVSYISTFNKG
jgi:mono/diheme cytochrome c family protein